MLVSFLRNKHLENKLLVIEVYLIKTIFLVSLKSPAINL